MTRPLERSTEGKAETKGHVEKDPNLGWCDRQGGSQGEAQTVNTRNELEMQLLSTWSGPGLEELKVSFELSPPAEWRGRSVVGPWKRARHARSRYPKQKDPKVCRGRCVEISSRSASSSASSLPTSKPYQAYQQAFGGKVGGI